MHKTQTIPPRQAPSRQGVNRKIVFCLAVGAAGLLMGLRGAKAQTAFPVPPPPPTVTVDAPPTPYQISASKSFTFAQNLARGYGTFTMDVFALQHILFEQGHLALLPTGYFGNLTERAVKKFQTAHGIDQTGIVGVLTRKALNAFWQ